VVASGPRLKLGKDPVRRIDTAQPPILRFECLGQSFSERLVMPLGEEVRDQVRFDQTLPDHMGYGLG
jgi:hypothetical protein